MPTPREDRRAGRLLPTPITPPTEVCFKITIPNAVQYRAALFGVLNQLGEWSAWDHPLDGTECVDCEEATQLWRNAIAQATFSEECTDPMSCADVANCIETNPAVQNAINQQITNNTATQYVYDTAREGKPLTAIQREQPIVPADVGCDNDVLFGSISAIVDQLDKNNLDFLQIMEIGTNTRERVSQVIAAIPLIETLPINEVIDFVDKAQSEILEHYEAQWTTALYDEYRCGIFCMALEQPGCAVDFDLLFNYFNNRLGASLEPINFFSSLVEFFLLGTWAGTEVVDIMMLIQLGVWREASNWLGVSLRTLQTVGLLGANDPNPDWSVIPCACGSGEKCVLIDFQTTNGAAYGIVLTVEAPGVPLFTSAVQSPGVGLVYVASGDHDRTFGRFPDGLPEGTASVEMNWVYQDPATAGNVYADTDFGTATSVSLPTTQLVKEYEAAQPNYIFGGDKPGADVTPFIIIKSLRLRGIGEWFDTHENC